MRSSSNNFENSYKKKGKSEETFVSRKETEYEFINHTKECHDTTTQCNLLQIHSASRGKYQTSVFNHTPFIPRPPRPTHWLHQLIQQRNPDRASGRFGQQFQ